MLIDVNVLKSQKMIFNFEHNTLTINNCQNIKVTIDLISRIKFYLKRIIRTQKAFTIYFDQIVEISITYKSDLLKNRNFLFESYCSKYLNYNNDVFAHIINVFFYFV